MQHTLLGSTGLVVSVAGLGTGGHSRLGQAQGKSEAESIALIHAALDLGINLIDTARVYGTQPIVGEALKGRRDDLIISTKTHIADPPFAGPEKYLTGEQIAQRLEESLKELQTDYVDIYHLHGLEAPEYRHAVDHVMPVLDRLREQGKLRYIGVTERFITDPGHEMLSRAAEDGLFDVAMLGFNLLNPSARSRVLPQTSRHGVGTLNMFAVRRGLNSLENLREAIALGVEKGQLDAALLNEENPLAFLTADGVAESLTEAAYRFCRHQAGINVVLTGTGSIDHLRQNVTDINRPPLPDDALDRLHALFGNVDCLSGN